MFRFAQHASRENPPQADILALSASPELGRYYFEYTVRDRVAEVRTVVWLTRFGFPSASTPLPV